MTIQAPFEFTKNWPSGMAANVCVHLSQGMGVACHDFAKDSDASKEAGELLAVAAAKEFDAKTAIKLDYPFSSSFMNQLEREVERSAEGLVALWNRCDGKDNQASVAEFSYLQGYAEMTLFLDKHKEEAFKALVDFEVLIMEASKKKP